MDPQELIAKYFSGNASEEEKKELEDWFSSSEENRLEFMHLKEVWAYTGTDAYDVDNAWEKVRKVKKKEATVIQMNDKEDQKESPSYLKIAAAVVILIVATALTYNFFSDGSSAGISQGSSETISVANKDVYLTDGSKLFLDKLGQLTYVSDFELDNERKVKLSGKAFFDISENQLKPFIIETNNATIEVTGTSFQVLEKEGYTEVMVSSGSVRLKRSNSDTFITLKKGDIGVVSGDKKGLVKRRNKNVNYLSWMTHSFDFEKTTLSEVFNLLEDSYDVEIEVENKEINQCELVSQFKDRTIDEIMSIISVALQVDVQKKGEGQFVVSGESSCE